MLDRIRSFLPSLLSIVCILIVARIFSRWLTRNHGIEDRIWWKSHPKNALSLAFILFCITGPTLEELIFRIPLVLAFRELSIGAYAAILASGLLFGLVHLLPTKRNIDWGDGNKKEKPTQNARMLSGIIVGCSAGFSSVKFQSIWPAIGIHTFWNFTIAVIPLYLMLKAHRTQNFSFYRGRALRRHP